ncbi:Heterokaryon incompatibility protein [Paramyrothecium foliicola]|nr:Heterokaryon incompatibility protein [Paramyrothecium foliicola]
MASSSVPGRPSRHHKRNTWLPYVVDGLCALLIMSVVFIFYSVYSEHLEATIVRFYSNGGFNGLWKRMNGPCRPHADGGLPSADCIRLVEISVDTDGGVLIEASVFPLSSAPRYRALSYTWGHAQGRPDDASPFVEIPELGRAFPLNLVHAFFRISNLNESEWYWIDYQCILQNNERERGEQVGNMHRIYQQADAVDVWLGTVGPKEGARLNSILIDVAKSAKISSSGPGRPRPVLPGDLLPPADWELLRVFFSRRWFHRLWAMQEYAFAKTLRVLYGDTFIDAEVLHDAAEYLFGLSLSMQLDYGHNATAGYAVVQHGVLRKCLSDMDELLRLLASMSINNGGPTGIDDVSPGFSDEVGGMNEDDIKLPDYEAVLAWIFWRSAATFASDPRDYVYGILGMADAIMSRLSALSLPRTSVDAERLAHAIPFTPLEADYTLTTAQVYRTFVVRLMQGSIGIRAMTIIQGAQYEQKAPDHDLQRRAEPTWIDTKGELPSWVPNLANRDRFPSSMRSVSRPLERQIVSEDVFGSKDFSSTQRFSIRSDDLHVFGRRIGVIGERSYPFPYTLEPAPCLEFALNVIKVLNSLPESYCISEMDPVETLLATLSYGHWQPSSAGQHETRSPSPRDFESLLTGSLSFYVCIEMQGRELSFVDSILSRDLIQSALSIKGLSKEFLVEEVAKWRAATSALDYQSFQSCSASIPILSHIIEPYEKIASHFNSAKGQSVLSIKLDTPITPGFCKTSRLMDKVGTLNLMGLGPASSKKGDEVWALQGSNWPFILRPLYHEVNGESVRTESGTLHDEDSPSPKSSLGERLKVYSLIGEAYVHGIMNGELFPTMSTPYEFEEIIIR